MNNHWNDLYTPKYFLKGTKGRKSRIFVDACCPLTGYYIDNCILDPLDIGGGTTGTAVISNGKVIASVDDATGGHHVTPVSYTHLAQLAVVEDRGTDALLLQPRPDAFRQRALASGGQPHH